MGSKIKTTGHIGENWGARLKLARYEEHWQAQAMAMAGAGARLKLRGAMGNWGIALALHLWHIMTWETITGARLKLRGEMGN